MLLKSLGLLSFRQFLNSNITFSTDEIKNVTIIMGQNGSGKTTLAQAFTWCLYGETQFEDRIVLSKTIAIKLLSGEKSEAKVEINLEHNNTDYVVTRKQTFYKDTSGEIRFHPSKFSISYKERDGQKEFIDENKTDSIMKSILPQELSKYFFFDGERIGQMSKDVQRGKSKEFSDAVTSLLGLKAFKETFKHLKESNNSLIKTYAKSFDSSGNAVLTEIINNINDNEKEKEISETRLSLIKDEIKKLSDKISDLEAKILEYKESEELMKTRDTIRRKLARIREYKESGTNSVFELFNKRGQSYFSRRMIFDVLKLLSDTQIIDKGIPEISDKTIHFLINNKKCICGTPIDFNSDAYHKLIALLDYIPPKSIGVLINQFVETCHSKGENGSDLFNETQEKMRYLREREGEKENLEEDLSGIEKKLSSMKNVGILQSELKNCEINMSHLNSEKDENNVRIGKINGTLEQLQRHKQEYTLKDEKNRKIEIYKAYAEFLYNALYSEYSVKEAETRIALEEKINIIFKHIYNGGLSLSLDENYFVNIKVTDHDGYNSGVEASTAQSISVIFAFIAGVIEMAKQSKDDENKMLVSEPYPLVMDAPLSSFDTTRIKTVCDILPTVAQQVIIFIKDTDGLLAEKHMGNHVGSRYSFDKKNEFETEII
jgi:DNA sulfur modification protein DndD